MDSASFEDLWRRLEAHRQELVTAADDLAAREFVGVTGDGSVRVTVDGSGAVRAVRVDPSRFRALPGDELGRGVRDAVRAAHDACGAEISDARAALAGELQRLGETVTGHGSLGGGGSAEPGPGSVDGLMRELRRFREELPGWASTLTQRRAYGRAASGSVRASCALSGEVTEVEIDTRFLRNNRSGQVDAAILAALRAAQSAAAGLLAAHQEQLQLMGFPIGEVVSGRRSLADLFPTRPASYRPPLPDGRATENR